LRDNECHKKNKQYTNKSSQQKCFFTHGAFHAQSPKNCGLESFFAALSVFIGAQDAARFGGLPYRFETLYPKSSYALATTQAGSFFRFLPEACLLTGSEQLLVCILSGRAIGPAHIVATGFNPWWIFSEAIVAKNKSFWQQVS
jgi:hypothetical protein